jgi:hypothetical protein
MLLAFRRHYQIILRGVALLIGVLGGHRVTIFAPGVVGFAPILIIVLNFFEWLNLIQDFIRLPLSPQELVVGPVFEVAHRPPEARFKCGSDED